MDERMKTSDLIRKLQECDPSGDLPVQIYVDSSQGCIFTTEENEVSLHTPDPGEEFKPNVTITTGFAIGH